MISIMDKASLILPILHGLGKNFGKDYCYPSQNKILNLLKTRVGVNRCRRTLNYWLRAFEDVGLIKRTRRHRHDGTRGMLFNSTMYFISLKGYQFLSKLGIKVFQDLAAIKSKMAEGFKNRYMKGKKFKKPSIELREYSQGDGKEKGPVLE